MLDDNQGTIELKEDGQLLIKPSSTIKAVSMLNLRSSTDSYDIRASLFIDILYHCSVCGNRNMNYEENQFHKESLDHMFQLQKKLECYEQVTECDDDTVKSVASFEEDMMISKQVLLTNDEDDEGGDAPQIIIDAVDEFVTPRKTSPDIVVPPAPMKRKRDSDDLSDNEEEEDDEDIQKFDKPMTGDGNCLFRSLADQIYGDQSYHLLLRYVCYLYLKKHPEVGFEESETQKSLSDGFKFGTLAGDLETKIISMIYHFRIETIDKKDGSILQPWGNMEWATLRVLYSENHYDSCIPVSDKVRNFSDVFGRFHWLCPGKFENAFLKKEGIPTRLPQWSRIEYSLKKFYLINPKSFGLVGLAEPGKKCRATVIDTAFAFSEMLTDAENFALVRQDNRRDTIYYKLLCKDSVVWCSRDYLLRNEGCRKRRRFR